ncbi:putative RND superfamily exporter protein [Pseudomonas citronellolis]|uniref:efflux RND transporter permease subunit n=1 Tax=Pseudomonas citronellolis TaxID=53408 RepID=UPI00209F0D26|nr:MMPL family transporter [Pseudomonas citronellolis]MCP1645518.1 putative RND superfamily exporter protein [Pseudomonas citronellolis]MCP1668359.1 putative RND superfamily exporter protein [Pseudomonas citronellolis]MCP1700733.1 putative RND superfamily exporter protein [Pseudomonas citronellolis]MCP1706274.1 putative RND superfamily exporter protein [Pseudomonas citronellolis]MCP1801045.1 putative RND superfamily exporter protein [Pseudomonas citronellolis]
MHAPTSPAPSSGRLDDFDSASGSLLERALFNHRGLVLLLCLAATLLLGWQATRLTLNASFEKMIPREHPFILNYLDHRQELAGLGNAVRIAVANPQGSIYDKHYLQVLQQLNDEVYLLPGVDRAAMKSLWTPSTRWTGVTEDGLEGGPVIPDGYDGGAASLEALKRNVERSNEIGQLVAFDQRSSILYVPLLEKTPDGQALDYTTFAHELEALRGKYQARGVDIHITGFAKVVGDLIDGLKQILLFFAAAIAITAAVLYWYTRCVRSTALVVLCSLVAVVWQLGLLPLLGYELDPYSVLVPFLVFAIGMSHGAQKMNGIMQDIGRGMHRLVAARFTFRRLFLAGLTALLCDAVGFAVLMIIRIQVIQDLAVIASLGVAVLIFTNLILLPVLLSYVGVSPKAARRSLRAEEAEASGADKHAVWRFLDLFTQRRWAALCIVVAALLAAGGYAVSLNLKIGDLDAGAPELRPDSRYNRDNAFVTQHYGASSDVFAVMVQTPAGACSAYDTLKRVDDLDWQLRGLPGVDSTNSLALLNRRVLVGLSEGSPKWYELVNNQATLNMVTANAPRGLYNDDCSLLTLYAYLTDHKADTLARVVDSVQAFARDNDSEQAKFLLAAGSAGIEAATNIVVRQANHDMLWWVYGAVILLCLVTFRSWRAVLCAVLPLVLTSILCEALMVALGIGVKVATLPVIALGVGIGVDYALYVMSIVLAQLRQGASLSSAYYRALLFTGKVVMLTGVTLAIGVGTWIFSPIKFQADMGVLLAFMFVWNMVGALVLLPALAYFLLPRRQAQPAAPAHHLEEVHHDRDCCEPNTNQRTARCLV